MPVEYISDATMLIYDDQWSTYEEWGRLEVIETKTVEGRSKFFYRHSGHCVYADMEQEALDNLEWYESTEDEVISMMLDFQDVIEGNDYFMSGN